MIKAADMLIARRADTKARADFATWKMMGKLNGASALPAEAQAFLGSYRALLGQMPETEATDAAIHLVYRSYYKQMGGTGAPPEIPAQANDKGPGNVTAFRRPAVQRPGNSGGPDAKPRLPTFLMFAGIIVVLVGFRYYFLQ